MKKIAVVILIWNGKKWLEKFLPSIVEHNNNELSEIIVADNASTDDSLTFISANYPTIRTIILEENFGFTGGYNKSLAQLNHEYFVLLNSDIEVTANWIEPVLLLMEQNKNIAACQPKILNYNNKKYFEYAGASGGQIDYLGYPFCRGRIMDTLEEDKGQYNEARQVFWATGACMFVRSEVYKTLGGLDENFFAHMEEIDLCWRMQNAGYEVWVEPKATVYHVGGGTLQADNPRKTFYNFRNNLFMILKNETIFKAILKISIRLILDGVAGVRFFIQGKFAHVWAIIKAHFAFYFNSLSYLKNRSQKQKINTIYNKSIIWQYFINGKKKYQDL